MWKAELRRHAPCRDDRLRTVHQLPTRSEVMGHRGPPSRTNWLWEYDCEELNFLLSAGATWQSLAEKCGVTLEGLCLSAKRAGVPVPPAARSLGYRLASYSSGRHKPKRPVTHCPRGHEYTPENTYVTKPGGKRCRVCQVLSNRRWYLAHRDEVLARQKAARRAARPSPSPTIERAGEPEPR